MAATGLNLELSDCRVEENAVTRQMLARDSACLKSIGIDRAHCAAARFKFLDGKINLVTADVAADENRRWDSTWIVMENWIRVQFRDEQKKMDSPAATGTTPRQQGELAGKLCNAWAAANQ